MYKLILCSHIDGLADALCNASETLQPDDPLIPFEIIIPNRDTARWLSLYMSRRQGIAGNISYTLPSEWIWRQIRRENPDLPGLLPSDIGPLTWRILSLLTDAGESGNLAGLRSILDRSYKPDESEIWHMSRQISSVFDQYQIYRPELLLDWESGRAGNGPEKWQAALWNRLLSQQNSAEAAYRHPHRPRLFQELMDRAKSGDLALNEPVVLFNPGLMPVPFIRVFRLMAAGGDVFHYAIATSEAIGLGQQDGTISNEFLHQFGEEQRENFELYKTLDSEDDTKTEVTRIFYDRDGSSDLRRIQKALVSGSPFPGLEKPDGSIEIHSCHSPFREVEVLYQFILRKLEEYDDLDPEEILVVTPDIERYRPSVEAVFGTREEGLPEIPFTIAGSGSKNRSTLLQAFTFLIHLSESRFRKDSIIDFLNLSSIREKFKLADSDLRKIDYWFEENGVIWGLDGEHRNFFDQPETEHQTWEFALRRGWYGQWLSREPGEFKGEMLLYSGIRTQDDKMLWATFSAILRSLSGVREEALQKNRPEQWNSILKKWIDTFLPESDLFEPDLQRVRDAVSDSTEEMKAAGLKKPVSFDLVRNSILEKLGRNTTGTTSFMRGVTFNSMVPVRSLPYTIIAMLGLTDDQFPRKSLKPDFDLMASNPVPGERDRKKEDKNLFLESVMAAEKVHYSSYTGRNQTDNAPVPASPILEEWIQLLSGLYRRESEEIEWVEEEPLNGFSAELFKVDRSRSYSAVNLNAAQLLKKAGTSRGIVVDEKLDLPDESGTDLLTPDELERFFRHPVRYFFRNRLGIRLKSSEQTVREEFKLDSLEEFKIFQKIFYWLLNGLGEDQIEKLVVQSGRIPAGWPGQMKVYELMERAGHAIEEIKSNGMTPVLKGSEIDLSLTGVRISGNVYSYSQENLLDLHLSDLSGKRIIQSWLRHLLFSSRNGANHKTYIYSGFRKGNGKWAFFEYEPEADKILLKLHDIYTSGLIEPLNLYTDSAFEYAKVFNKQGDEKKALAKALHVWGGDFTQFNERSDLYLEYLLGRDAEADPSAIKETFERIYKDLLKRYRSK